MKGRKTVLDAVKRRRAKTLHSRGFSMRDIARMIGCSYGPVWKYLAGYIAPKSGDREMTNRDSEMLKFLIEQDRWVGWEELSSLFLTQAGQRTNPKVTVRVRISQLRQKMKRDDIEIVGVRNLGYRVFKTGTGPSEQEIIALSRGAKVGCILPVERLADLELCLGKKMSLAEAADFLRLERVPCAS